MPIFQDDLGGGGNHGSPPAELSPISSLPSFSNSSFDQNLLKRKVSEESIRTELCEGPIPDSPKYESDVAVNDLSFARDGTSNRTELIQRLKRGESPTWLQNRKV